MIVFFFFFLMKSWLWFTIRVISLWSDVFTNFLKRRKQSRGSSTSLWQSRPFYVMYTSTNCMKGCILTKFCFTFSIKLRSRVFLLYGNLWIDQAFCCQDLFVEKNINYLTFVFVLLEIKWSLMQVFCFF